jgi:two-component system cell cycle response regulator
MRSDDKSRGPAVDRLELLRNEFADRLPTARRAFEVFQSQPDRWDQLEELRDLFHKLAGVAGPSGAPLLGGLAKVAEEFIILLSSGKASVAPGTFRLLQSAVSAAEEFLLQKEPIPGRLVSRDSTGVTRVHKVLVVDDDPLSARLIEVCLGEAGFVTHYCKDSREAVTALDAELPDLILLDLMMPGQDGFETCRQIRAAATTDRIPIIFLTRVADLSEKVEALRSGGDDYITKPFEPLELVARVRAHIQRHASQREELIRDALTGAFSHRYFKQRYQQEIRRSEKGQTNFSVAMIDLDKFKQINDVHGHLAGDATLKAFVQQAGTALRSVDVLARYGGDEFAVLLPDTTGYQAAAAMDRLLGAVRALKVTPSPGKTVTTTVSVGVAERQAGDTPSGLLERADTALYKAKKEGRNRMVVAGAPTPKEARPAEPKENKRYSILIVDDSRLTREVLRLYLMSLDVTITDSENGVEALKKVKEDRPNLVLADLRMPLLDGVGLCKALKAEPSTASIPAIILTGHLEPEVYKQCIEAGAREVLSKPVEPVELLNVVNRHLERR